MKLSQIRDTHFGDYEDFPDQCSYPYAVKAAWYEELVTCHVPIASTWDASLKCDYDRIGDSRKRDKANKKDKANPIRISNLNRTAEYLRKHGFKVTRVHVGRTRKGFHVRIWLDPYVGGSSFKGMYTVLKLQAMLGDDPFRQAFNASRVRRKRRGWNILFTSKIHNGVITSREVFDLDWTLKVSKIFGLGLNS